MDGTMATTVVEGASTGAASGAWGGIPGALAGAVIGGGLSLIGGRNSAKRMEILAQEQRAWEEAMSKTAHWWEAHDLESAGLNRILTATGGAGMSYHGSPPAPTTDYITPAVNSATSGGKFADSMREAALMVDNIRRDTELKTSSTELNEWQSELSEANRKKVDEEAKRTAEETKNLEIEGKILKEDLMQAQSTASKARNLKEIEDSKVGGILRWVEAISNAVRGGGSAAGSWRRPSRR